MAIEPTLIRPRDLTAAPTVFANDALVVDDGVNVQKATPVQIANAGAPVSSEAQALAGIDNTTRMTPLRVRQAVSDVVYAEQFTSRAAFAAWISGGNIPVPGRNYGADGLFYVGEAGATSIVDMPGVVPVGIPQPGHYGIFGAGSYTTVKNKALRDFAVDKSTGAHFAQSGAVINRISDRVFLGAAIESDGAWPNVEQDWLTQYQRSHALKLVLGTPATGVTTLGSPVVTFAAGGITPLVGAFFTSNRGVPQGATVVSVDSPTQVTISVNATATTTGATFWSDDGRTAGGITNSSVLASLTEKTPGSSAPAVFGAQSAYANAAGTSCIGMAAFAVNNHPTLRTVGWAGYFEAHRMNGAVGGVNGIEIDITSRAPSETRPTPFAQTATNGMLIGAGSGLTADGQTNPGCAINIVANPMKFRTGLVFSSDSIEGTDGYTGGAVAIAMGNGHQMAWYAPDGNISGRIMASPGTEGAQRMEMRFMSSGIQFLGASGQVAALFQQVAASVNYPSFIPAAAGNPVVMSAAGTDANIDFSIISKGPNGRTRVSNGIRYGAAGPIDAAGAGTPEGALAAPVGSTYRRTDGGAGTAFYVKETGTGNTGWVAK